MRNSGNRASLRVLQMLIGVLSGVAMTNVVQAQALEVVIGLDFSRSDATALRSGKTAATVLRLVLLDA